LERAKQFRVGQAFQFRGRQGSSQRRHLAWIGENHDLYVFADKEGNKAASLTLHELAMQLRRGAIKLAGSTEVTAIDQALRAATYSVFHDIHHAACHDRTTDLENRQAFIQRLSAAMARSEGVSGLLGHVQLKAPPEANERWTLSASMKSSSNQARFCGSRCRPRVRWHALTGPASHGYCRPGIPPREKQ